jgi:2-polyprenyl-3-methyl-5-hydroxy-6-metoxy-1,4-benzoquinol methylase
VESLSGRGSDSDQTAQLKLELPLMLKELGVKTLLDLPCGDLNWMKDVDLGSISYTGADIVPQLIADLTTRFRESGKDFICLDATRQNPGKYDAIFCRDMLVHLSHKDIIRTLKMFKGSGSRYLLTTHFTDQRPFEDLKKLGWRPINFTLEPFSFPSPLKLLNERCTEAGSAFLDKSIAVWRLEDLTLEV